MKTYKDPERITSVAEAKALYESWLKDDLMSYIEIECGDNIPNAVLVFDHAEYHDAVDGHVIMVYAYDTWTDNDGVSHKDLTCYRCMRDIETPGEFDISITTGIMFV